MRTPLTFIKNACGKTGIFTAWKGQNALFLYILILPGTHFDISASLME